MQGTLPEVSVVIPFYGDPQATMPVVDFLLADGLPSSQIIVADDESFHTESEEVDLQMRFSLLGLPRVRIGRITLVHEGGGSTDSTLRTLWVTRSRFVYARKWTHPRTLRAGLTAASTVNAVVNVVRRLRNPDVTPIATLRHELALISRAAR